MKTLLIAGSYVLAIVFGFSLGIYALPILVAPAGLSNADVAIQARSSLYSGQFRRNLKDSDFLHWGEGIVYVGVENITLHGEVSPGPDYKLYLSPEFVETEDDFDRVKPRMTRIGDVRVFKNLLRSRAKWRGRKPLQHRSRLVRDVPSVHQRGKIPIGPLAAGSSSFSRRLFKCSGGGEQRR
jgi:hypothetical protein